VKLRPALAAALFGTALLTIAVAPTALASDDNRVAKITMRDRCDPTTFNAVLGPGSCVPHGDGVVTFDRFFGFLATHSRQVFKEENALGWRFTPDKTEIKAGGALNVRNVGGEVHTFTEVTDVGFQDLGCIQAVNQVLFGPATTAVSGLCPAPNVLPGILVFPGQPPVTVAENEAGVEKYQCMIHPWMRTTIKVEGREGRD
jgi:plastocyanin